MSNKNIIIAAVVIAVILGGAGFYGGMKYGSNKTGGTNTQFGQRQGGALGQNGQNKFVGRRASGAGFVNGQIISKDDKSITVKSSDGGSKIIFLSATTQISKSATGTISDLSNDTQVVVNGTTNPDGSITAAFVQIRPQGGQDRPQGFNPAAAPQAPAGSQNK